MEGELGRAARAHYARARVLRGRLGLGLLATARGLASASVLARGHCGDLVVGFVSIAFEFTIERLLIMKLEKLASDG